MRAECMYVLLRCMFVYTCKNVPLCKSVYSYMGQCAYDKKYIVCIYIYICVFLGTYVCMTATSPCSPTNTAHMSLEIAGPRAVVDHDDKLRREPCKNSLNNQSCMWLPARNQKW